MSTSDELWRFAQEYDNAHAATHAEIFGFLIRAVEGLQRVEMRVANLEGSRDYCIGELGKVLPMPSGGPYPLERYVGEAIRYIRRLESRNWTCVKCSQVNAHWATKCGRCDTEAP